MQERSLFSADNVDAECRRIRIADAELSFYEQVFSVEQSDQYLQALLANTPWRHDQITIHGKTMPLPRLQAWYSDVESVLHYSGMRVEPLAWTEALLSIHERVWSLTGLRFNGVLANCYRNGNDSVGWHSDNEAEFGTDPIIASVSFGESRQFDLKHLFKDDVQTIRCQLSHGSLLVMGNGVQKFWKHQLPKRKNITQPRVNLTFRNIVQ